jgi:hypothetical protein
MGMELIILELKFYRRHALLTSVRIFEQAYPNHLVPQFTPASHPFKLKMRWYRLWHNYVLCLQLVLKLMNNILIIKLRTKTLQEAIRTT